MVTNLAQCGLPTPQWRAMDYGDSRMAELRLDIVSTALPARITSSEG
jgi:hypothetical protein